MNDTNCVFCGIASGTEPAEVLWAWPDAIMIRPRNPVAEGHALVLPVKHVRDAAEDPEVTAAVMRRAASMCHSERPMNLITSIGIPATQSVFHLHVHLVPRAFGDGLALPWTGQQPQDTSAEVQESEPSYADKVNAPLSPETIEALRRELASGDPARYRKPR